MTRAIDDIRTSLNGVFVQHTPGEPVRLSDLYAATESPSLPDVQYSRFHYPARDFSTADAGVAAVNSLVPAAFTKLQQPASAGDISVVVSDPSLFGAGGLITIHELGQPPQVIQVEQVSGSIVRLRRPLAAAFSLKAVVGNSDLFLHVWRHVRPINILIEYEADTPNPDAIGDALAARAREFFDDVILPEEPLDALKLREHLAGVSGVNAIQVFLGRYGVTEQVQASAEEQIQLGMLSINGVRW